ncbi:MAG: phosphate/phosphite/phosphonate ABC transporter substrate-binding protein, partial [Gammaproteobacteria bacterium]
NLQGKKIAFEKPLSTSGYYLPLSTLLNHNLACVESGVGEAEKEAVRFMFAGTELNQAYWVHSGKVDAGAFNDSDWDVTPKQIRKDLRIIYQTNPVMRWLFSFHKNMPVGLRRKVTAILTGMHEDPNGKSALRDAKNIARIEKFSKQDEMDFKRWKDLLTPLVGLQ